MRQWRSPSDVTDPLGGGGGLSPVPRGEAGLLKPKRKNPGDEGWLEAEGSEGSRMKQGDLVMSSIAVPRPIGHEVRPNPKCPGPTLHRASGSEAINANSGKRIILRSQNIHRCDEAE